MLRIVQGAFPIGTRSGPNEALPIIGRETFVLPDGRSSSSDVVRRPQIAVVVAVSSPDNVVLLNQFRPILGEWIWEVPAGKLENESPEQCAMRELEEEAGYRTTNIKQLGSVLLEPGFTDELMHLFVAFDLSPSSQSCEADEFITVHHIPLLRVLEMIWSGEIRDAKSILALLYASKHLSGRSSP